MDRGEAPSENSDRAETTSEASADTSSEGSSSAKGAEGGESSDGRGSRDGGSDSSGGGSSDGSGGGSGDGNGGGSSDGSGDGSGNGDGESDADAEGEGDDEGEQQEAPPEPTLWAILRECYFSFDRRTLGFTRILLGFLLITDLFRRSAAWDDMFSDKGVLPNHVNLFRPQAWNAFSFVNAFSTSGELKVLWIVTFLTFVCVLIGYKTRVAQVLSLIFVASMNGRVLLIENGGYVVYNLLLMWTCFLPMGDRFSVDAMLASMKSRREATEDDLNDRTDLVPQDKLEPYVSLIGLAILLQISAIYFFNVVHKTGPAWKNGTAVHYVLYVDRMVTPLIGHIRAYLPRWSLLFLTRFVLASEAGIPVALLSPLGRVWARRIAVVLMNAMHLGFGSVFVLGPFAWALCVFSTLLFSREDWEIATRTMRRPHRARVVLYDPSSGAAFFVCRVLKRLDRYELLTFRASPVLEGSLAVEKPGGSGRVTRSLAAADMIAALPLGPTVAWIPRLPGVRHALDALIGWIESRGPSRFFGLRAPASAYVAPPPAPLRMQGRRALHVAHEVGVALMLAAAVNQAMVELWVVNRRIKVGQPEPLRTLAQKLRFLQGWFMFSPNPVMDDGTIVVDAITVDGRHIDPFTGKEPNWELTNAKSLGLTQIWCDYFNRMHKPENTGFRDAMKEYMYRLPERTGRPEDAIVSGEVYWIQDLNPKWGEHESYKYEKVKLFDFDNTKVKATLPRPPQGAVPGFGMTPSPGSMPAPAVGSSPVVSGQQQTERVR